MGVGPVPEGPIFVGREEPSERPCKMSVHPFLNRKPQSAAPIEPYFSAEMVEVAAPRLRPLTALEQMYAYWGSDRA